MLMFLSYTNGVFYLASLSLILQIGNNFSKQLLKYSGDWNSKLILRHINSSFR